MTADLLTDDDGRVRCPDCNLTNVMVEDRALYSYPAQVDMERRPIDREVITLASDHGLVYDLVGEIEDRVARGFTLWCYSCEWTSKIQTTED